MKHPRATYRLQFNSEFGFAYAARIAPYLAQLGISHVYASPYLKSRPGSTHGYDIVAHGQLNPELGDETAFRAMHTAFVKSGLGQLLDFVPNHMGVGGADNPLWLDVLEWGPQSQYAGWFDIDWEPDHRYLTEKLLVPILSAQFGVALEAGDLVVKFDMDAGDFALWAYDTHKLPICPLEYGRILGNEQILLESVGDAFASLLEWRPQMQRRANELKRELAEIIAHSVEARLSLERSLARLNGASDPARPELNALIQTQYWRASHFRAAGDDINYRRFFNVNDLAGLRIELPEVFEHAHGLVLRLLRDGVVDGLRIDHIDGLMDPQGYLHRLRASVIGHDGQQPFYLVVEKILAHDESLPADWPVDGSTGYDFANLVTGLLVDSSGAAQLMRAYRDFTGLAQSFSDIVRDCKIRIMRNEMASELNVLARDAARVARQNPRTADFTRNLLRRAIRELIACFAVYRTYLTNTGVLSTADRARLRAAVSQARRNERDIDASVFEFLENMLSGELVAKARSGFSRHTALRCAMKFQQYSGPVMAKGLEDTAFYRFNRFIAVNEVGGNPDVLGISLQQFHDANRQRANQFPHAMLSTSTHDTKRGEDTRARLSVLSEMPQQWQDSVSLWSSLLREPLSRMQAPAALDRNDEYLFYQTLLGSWPPELSCPDTVQGSSGYQQLKAYQHRVHAAIIKSAREAKLHSSWYAPDDDYERKLGDFISGAFDSQAFLRSFMPFQEHVARMGVLNSLIQVALKLTVPGVPDVYQGAEAWNLSMVDPDNRRLVDFAAHESLLRKVKGAWESAPVDTLRESLRQWQDGSIKLLMTWLLLKLRQDNEAIFMDSTYEPCEIEQSPKECIGGFIRRCGAMAVLVVFARFPQREQTQGRTGNLLLPTADRHRNWREVFTKGKIGNASSVPVAKLLEVLPIAVLVSESD